MKVLVFGTFDLLHKGHVFFLESAKKLGDELIVVVARDKTVKKIKKITPTDDEKKRQKNVEETKIASQALLGNLNDPLKIIVETSPDIIVLGYDQNSFTKNLIEKLNERGLNPKIVRMTASYQPEKYKSSILRSTNKNKNNS